MSNDRNAQELLKWGLANSASTGVASFASQSVEQISADIEAGRRPDLADPNLYNAIMGKSEAQMMAEELSVAIDTSRTLPDRMTALDNFEMLIEQIDNANNMTSMKMWSPIISLLSAPEAEIQTAAAWIIGTAVQNNDKAQMAVLDFHPVAALLDLLHSHVDEVRAKAMYALSGLLKHNPAAMHQFDQLDGWNMLNMALVDPNLGLRRKTAFLINALLLQDPNSLDSQPASTSTATAIAPVSFTPPTPTAPPAPLERGPETLRTSIPHPNVARALVQSNIINTLISSLLPAHTLPDTLSPPPTGANGDSDARLDLDFAEKSAAAILTFTTKLPPSPSHPLDPTTISLFKALLVQLQAKPLDSSDPASTRWAELGIHAHDFDQFKHKIHAL